MLANNNNSLGFNSFLDQPKIPYQIINFLMESESESAKSVWKLLKYPTQDAMSKPDLSIEEKLDLVWTPKQPEWEHEEKYTIFLKPLIGNALDTAEQQTQLRLFRYHTQPRSRTESVVLFEFDILTNEKTSMVYDKDDVLCERCDLIESNILNVLNGSDIGIGQNYLRFDAELSRSCQSTVGFGNSKTFYGRTFFMALLYVYPELGGTCG